MSGPVGSEADRVRERYARRDDGDRYAAWAADVMARVHERQRATRGLLAARLPRLADLDILEVGCGGGANLLEWLQWGATPRRLTGNDLLSARLDRARSVLPPAVRLFEGDACVLPFEAGAFDIVHQSTVFSSLLDGAFQQRLAQAMWRWVKPGGGVLWYDFTVDNPRNRDVRGVPLARVRALFPQGRLTVRRITLAPPLARAVCRVHPVLYPLFNALPPLRTHVLAWIEKPIGNP